MSFVNALACIGIPFAVYGILLVDLIGYPESYYDRRKTLLYIAGAITTACMVISLIPYCKVTAQYMDTIYARSEGTYCYIASVTNEKGVSYRLPAEVDVEGRYDYNVPKVYFPNGSNLDFRNDIPNFDREDMHNHVSAYAEDYNTGKRWKIELLDVKGYSDYINDSDKSPTALSYLLFAVMLWFAFCSAAYIIYPLSQRNTAQFTWERKEVKKNATEEGKHNTSI